MDAYHEETSSTHNHILQSLISIGANLPNLIRNYNYLVSLEDWSEEQEEVFQGFVYHLVFVIREMQQSSFIESTPGWNDCLQVLIMFENAIKNSRSITEDEAIRMNLRFHSAMQDWASELN